MSSFGFAAPNTSVGGSAFSLTAKTTPSFGLGSNSTTTSLFGTPQQSTAQAGVSFGTATPNQNNLFVSATTTPATGLGFGTPSSGQSTGLTFGTASTGLTFGTPSTQPQPLQFGTPSTQAQPATFGALNTQAQPISFGTPSTSAQPLSFGTPTTTTQAGITFGSSSLFSTPVNQPASTLTAGTLQLGPPASTTQPTLGFGSTSMTSAPTGFQFGAPTSAAQPSPALGTSFATAITTAGTSAAVTTSSGSIFSSTVPTFGASSTIVRGFGLPVTSTFLTTTTTSSIFTTPVTSTGAAGFNLSVAASKPLGFFTTQTSTVTSAGISTPIFAAAAVTTSADSLFSGFAKPAATTAATTTRPSSSVGLGGLDSTQSKGLASSLTTGTSAAKPEAKSVKESAVPNEILQTVDGFKNFVKAQKGCCSDIARSSPKTLHKVQEDIELLKQMLASVVSDLQRNITLSSRLKSDTDKCLQTVEMAQKTHDTPPGLQFENIAPDQYFEDLITNFENQIQVFKQEVDRIEAHVNAVLNPKPLSSQELCLALKRLVDCFVALAGRLHTVHSMVENQKEQYLNLRKYFLKDTTNIFEDENKKPATNTLRTKGSMTVSVGPTAFSELGNQGIGILSSALTKAQLPSSNPLGWNTNQQQSSSLQLQLPQQSFSAGGFFSGGRSTNTNTLSTVQPVENQSFQLQKPPVGNKRGKRI